jgi:hypothetical protein
MYSEQETRDSVTMLRNKVEFIAAELLGSVDGVLLVVLIN